MQVKFIVAFAALGAAMAGTAAHAQMSPVGVWQSSDDKTKEAKAEITITESGGVLTGKITKRLAKNAKADEVCDECTDNRKGKPILGLEIIRGAKKEASEDVWAGGKILDPENGKDYSLKLTPIDGGKKLQVRPFGRTQTWSRVQ
jgi:uncharacterized protein (DUF2147 family)